MANEQRLIDLDKAFEAINQEVWWTESEKAYFRSFLVKQPKVDAVEVVHGRWVDNGIPDSMLSGCSVCGFPCGAYSFNYCPNCGATMDLKENKNEQCICLLQESMRFLQKQR